MGEGDIPNGTTVKLHSLQNDVARWMNGQRAIIVQWCKEAERYEVRLLVNNEMKKVKATNLWVELPNGWEEHYDEHTSRHYYLNIDTQRVTWKHPKVANLKGKMGRVVENNAEEFETVEIDKDHVHYDVDDEAEGEGNFNLSELVRKVVSQEELKEGGEDVDSDDGMHRARKKRKEQVKVTVEVLETDILSLMEQTMVARATVRKDYSQLHAGFIASVDLDPAIVQLEEKKAQPPLEVLKSVVEVMLGGLEKAVSLSVELRRSKHTLAAVSRVVDRIPKLTDVDELLQHAKWVSAFLKTL